MKRMDERDKGGNGKKGELKKKEVGLKEDKERNADQISIGERHAKCTWRRERGTEQ